MGAVVMAGYIGRPQDINDMANDLMATNVDVPATDGVPGDDAAMGPQTPFDAQARAIIPPRHTSPSTVPVGQPGHPGYAAGLDSGALAAAQQRAQDTSRSSMFGRAGSELAAALGGYKADNSYWDAKEAQGQQGVKDLMQRRQATDQDLAHAGALRKDQAESDDTDPSSQASESARAMVKQGLPGVASALGDKLDSMSAAQVKENFPMMKELIEAGAKKRAMQRNSVESDAARKLYTDEIDRLQDQMKVPPEKRYDTTTLNNSELPNVVKMLREDVSEGGRAARAAGNAATQEKKLGIAGEILSIRRQKLADVELHQAGEAQQGLPVGKALIDPIKGVVPGSSRKIEDMEAAYDTIHPQLQRARDILEKNNGRMLPTNGDAHLFTSAMMGALGNVVKSENFGNMTKAHQELSRELVDDPTKLFSWINNSVGRQQIDELLSDIRHSIDVTQRRYNIRDLAPGEKQQTSAYAPSGGLKQAKANADSQSQTNDRVRVSINGQTGFIPASKLEEFKRDHPDAKVLQ